MTPDDPQPDQKRRKFAGRGLGMLWRWGKGKHDQRKLMTRVTDLVHRHIAVTTIAALSVGVAGVGVGTVGFVQADSARQQAADVAALLDTTSVATADMGNTVTTLTERLQVLAETVEDLSSAVATGDEEAAQLAADAAADVAGEVANLGAVVAGQADALQKVTDTQDGNTALIAALVARVDTIAGELSSLTARVIDQATQLDKLAKRADTLATQLAAAKGRLDTAEDGIQAAWDTLDTLTARVEALENRPERVIAAHPFNGEGALTVDVPTGGTFLISASVLYSHPGGAKCRVNATLTIDQEHIRTVSSEGQVPTASAAIPILEVVDLAADQHTFKVETEPTCPEAEVGAGAILVVATT